MGLSLFNRRICNTYTGVIKTCDNTNITVTPKPMTDGVGNDIPINIGTSTICYSGTQDFSGATVVGISGATAGLVSGVGTGSMVSDGSLGLLSTADGSCSISLGYGAYNDQERSISIGQGATGLCACNITIGFASNGNGNNALALGNNATVSANCGIAIGEGAQSGGAYAIGIGRSSNARCDNSISIGNVSDVLSAAGTAVGGGTCIGPSATSSTVVGQFATSCGNSGVAIGASTLTSGNCGITIGFGISNSNNCGIAMGLCQTLTLNTTSLCRNPISIGECVRVESNFGVAIGRCSCVLTNPNIFDAGIAIGAQACAFNLSAIAIGFDATSHCNSVSIGVSSEALGTNSVAINGYSTGNNAINIGGTFSLYGSCGDYSVAIGEGATTNAISTCSIAIGYNSTVSGLLGIAIGKDACAETRTIAIGCNSGPLAPSTGIASVYIGDSARGSWNSAIAIGEGAIINGHCAISIGCGTQTNLHESIAIGHSAKVISGDDAIAIGKCTCVNNISHARAIAIGVNVCSTRADTLTTCQFEACVAGCGIIVKTPDGLNSYRIAVDNSGNITTALA